MKEQYGQCAKCPFEASMRGCKTEGGKMPTWCSTALYENAVNIANSEYRNSEEIMKFAYNSSKQEAECYVPAEFNPQKTAPCKCRIQEIIEFCQKMGYEKIGFAFCMGLRNEAAKLNTILEASGLTVVSVVCKVGCTEKAFINISDKEKIDKSGVHESMCNPIAQAMVLNEEKTEFNLIMGLCVGHDSLFFKYSNAPVTVVAVKDRLLGHNPLAALSSGYYSFLKK